jgi:glycosyltransferase involved in cell wall biosynthesis
LNSFREAKRRGISCFYDLPIGYCRSAQKILQEEKELMPAFAPALQGISDSPEKLARKEEEALMADRILACSEFVRQTLIESGFPVEKIRTVQFGAPSQVSPRNWSAADLSRPLRFLFAGKLDQRKGIGYLLEALKLKNDSRIELTLLGRYEGAGEWLAPYRDFFRHVPALPHSGVLRLMKESDVMILPSLFEGQALVVLEAMACGIPVIITPNTGAASVVRDGQDGMVIPIRSSTAISEALEVLLQDRSRVVEMGRSAAARAEKFTWKSYESQVVEVIRERLEGKKGDEKN